MPDAISGGGSDDRTTVVGVSGPRGSDADAGPVASGGARIGRYLVIEELGRGGMGAVLRAYDPKLQREVALKVVHRDALDDSAQERLVREARAMARLNHPNVVGVFDVEFGLEVSSPKGQASAPTGVVMVMEYVRGSTLRQWVEQQARTLREVVDAFVQAGRGLAAAHADDVLHRDFKLANVLIGTDDRVRVTDFGLARTSATRGLEDLGSSANLEISSEGNEDLTIAGTVMGTPLYMPPEQLAGEELDARADQFAFCVALWRALTGQWPYSGRGRVLYDRKIAGPPRWPSEAAVPRHVVAAIRRGLSPDPAERWPSMLELLAELRRDPKKKVRRILAWGTLGFVVLGGWSVQYAARARARLGCTEQGSRIDEVWNEQRRAQIGAAFESTGVAYARETWARSTARLDAHAEAWRRVQVETCERAEVEGTWTREVAGVARACLDERLEELSATLEELVPSDVALMHRAATAIASLPLPRDCVDESNLRFRSDSSLDLQRRAARAELSRASAAFAMGRYSVARDRAAALLTWSSARDDPALRAEVQLMRGGALGRIGAFAEAREAFETAFVDAGRVGRDDLALRAVSALLFLVGYQLAQHGEALQWERVARMLIARIDDAETLEVAGLMNNLGAVHHSRGAFEEARVAFEHALRVSESVLGSDHLDVGRALNNLGAVHSGVEDYTAAKEAFAQALTIREAVLGSHHPDVAATVSNLGTVHASMRAFEAALVDHERALEIREELLGPEHPDVAVSLNNLGAAQRMMGRFADARVSHERALAIREKVLDAKHPDLASSLVNLGGVHHSLEDHARAQHYFERALEISEQSLGSDHPQVASALTGLGHTLRARGLHEEARSRYERAFAARERTFGPEHTTVASSLLDLASVDRSLGEHAQAVTRLERALAIREAADAGPGDRAAARWALAQALWESRTDRLRARELAIAAREELRSIGSDGERVLTEIEAWLRHDG